MEKNVLLEMGLRYPTNPVSPTMEILFRNDGIAELAHLSFLAADGLVKFNDPSLIFAITNSHSWGMDQNRKIRARFPLGLIWSNERFLDRVADGIESISICTENPLNAIMTSRQKKQQEAVALILAECLPQELIDEMAAWELDVEGAVDNNVRGLPGIRITVNHQKAELLEITLDGWSGCVFIGGANIGAFTGGQQIQNILRGSIDECLAKALN